MFYFNDDTWASMSRMLACIVFTYDSVPADALDAVVDFFTKMRQEFGEGGNKRALARILQFCRSIMVFGRRQVMFCREIIVMLISFYGTGLGRTAR